MAEEIGVGPSKPMRASCGAAKHALAYSKRFARRLAERKSVEALEAESHIVNQLRPDVLNLVHLIALGLGGTIGRVIEVSLSALEYLTFIPRHRHLCLEWTSICPVCRSVSHHLVRCLGHCRSSIRSFVC